MLFNSLSFLAFFSLVLGLFHLIPVVYRRLFLLLVSYFFYACFNPYYVLLLLGTTMLDFWIAGKMGTVTDAGKRKAWLFFSVASNIGVLAVFKYSGFFWNEWAAFAHWFQGAEIPPLKAWLIPAGLSFYTFQSLSYTIDVYRGKYPPGKDMVDFALFVSFFPHMVAGPIVRYGDLMPQLQRLHLPFTVDYASVIRLALWGYFKKMVVADRLAQLNDPMFAKLSSFQGLTLFFAGLLFAIQVYCDFSGYSDIATALARCFGIEFSLNWRRPFLSRSLHEFWQRNHISITTWFRDYLYIGLGGSRVSYGRYLLNIFLVFLISGFWHGANFTFVLWGATHGVWYLGEILIKKYLPSLKLPAALGWLIWLVFHGLTMIAFRAQSVEDVFYAYQHLGASCSLWADWTSILDGFPLVLTFSMVLIWFLKEMQEEWTWLRIPSGFKLQATTLFYMGIFVLLFLLGDFNANAFIYFQF